MNNKKFEIRLPASCANLGPGFDCLSLAIKKYLIVKAEITNKTKIEVKGDYIDGIPTNSSNLILKTYNLIFKEINKTKTAPCLNINIENNIPLERGLGSSSSAISAGCILAYLVSQINPKKNDIFNKASKLEGHPDNVGACIYGGLRVNKMLDLNNYLSLPFNIPYEVMVHLFIPDLKINTKQARKVLPSKYSRKDVIENITSFGMLMGSLHDGNWEHLKYCNDLIHEPYRLNIHPSLKELFSTLKKIDGTWVFLSGSGPTIALLEKGKTLNLSDKIKNQEIKYLYKKAEIETEGAFWTS